MEVATQLPLQYIKKFNLVTQELFSRLCSHEELVATTQKLPKMSLTDEYQLFCFPFDCLMLVGRYLDSNLMKHSGYFTNLV